MVGSIIRSVTSKINLRIDLVKRNVRILLAIILIGGITVVRDTLRLSSSIRLSSITSVVSSIRSRLNSTLNIRDSRQVRLTSMESTLTRNIIIRSIGIIRSITPLGHTTSNTNGASRCCTAGISVRALVRNVSIRGGITI
eukprot:9223410-Pyramimonas_sp.AAC.1